MLERNMREKNDDYESEKVTSRHWQMQAQDWQNQAQDLKRQSVSECLCSLCPQCYDDRFFSYCANRRHDEENQNMPLTLSRKIIHSL